MRARAREQAPDAGRSRDRIGERPLQPVPAHAREPMDSSRSSEPDSQCEDRQDQQRRQGHAVARMPVQVEVESDRRRERARRQHDVLEKRQPEYTPGCVAVGGSGAAESPEVDRESSRGTRRGQHAEAGHDGADARRQIELVAVVHPRDVANCQHIAEVGNRFAEEADRQPAPVVPPVGHVQDVRPTGVPGEDPLQLSPSRLPRPGESRAAFPRHCGTSSRPIRRVGERGRACRSA